MRLYLGDIDVLTDQLIDADGQPIDLSAATVNIDLYGPARIVGLANILTPPTEGKVEYHFTTEQVSVPGDYSGRWTVHQSGRIRSVPGVALRIVDPVTFTWASISDLELITDISDNYEAVRALEAATISVSNYLYVQPDPTLPIPLKIQQAVAIIASQQLNGGGGAAVGAVASEMIGDYQISYSSSETVSASSIDGNPVLRDLLSRWRPRFTNAFIGPREGDDHLPITTIIPESELSIGVGGSNSGPGGGGVAIQGPPGPRGDVWLFGHGPPVEGLLAPDGSAMRPGDQYQDIDTGDIYEFESA